MIVQYDYANKIFKEFNNTLVAPSLSPDYIVIDSKRETGLQPTFFVYEEEGNLYYHGFHLSTVPNTHYFDIQSAYGYGGPISTSKDSKFLKNAWENYKKFCVEHNVLAEFIRFHPILQNWDYYYGEVIADRETVWIDLKKLDLFSSYQYRGKRKIKKAQNANVSVQWCKGEVFFQSFPTLYKNLLIELQAEQFYNFPNEYYQMLSSWEKAHFALCYLEESIIAGAVFYGSGSIMEYHLSAADTIGKELGATSLLIHEGAILAQKCGFDYLHLGGGKNQDTNNPLLFFKKGFSNNTAEFKLGKMIHKQFEYDLLKDEFLSKGINSNRILFYR